jgi:hypothetical protein
MEDYNFQKARKNWGDASPLVTPKPWVGLTDVEVAVYETRLSGSGVAKEIETKLRKRNNG